MRVFLVDTNVLLYAVNSRSQHHVVSRAWLDDCLSGGATVGFAWVGLVGFVRIATLQSAFERPLSTAEAILQVEEWLGSPSARVLHPGERHTGFFADLLQPMGVAGNLVNDAHLAALAMEHKATVVSFDRDFARFEGLRWELPKVR